MKPPPKKCFLCGYTRANNLVVCFQCNNTVCENCFDASECTISYPRNDKARKCLGCFTNEGTAYSYDLPFSLDTLAELFGLDLNPKLISFITKRVTMTWDLPPPSGETAVTGDFLLGLMRGFSPEQRAEIFTALSPYENHSSEQTMKSRHLKVPPTVMMKSNFDKMEIDGLFFNENTQSYFYANLIIKDSTIKIAGKGVFTSSVIPKGSRAVYRGVVKTEKAHNPHYSWTISQWLPNGAPKDKIKYYKDATYLESSNWTRYVNCPPHGVRCNMTMDQRFSHIYYVATEDIEPGDELFIDYGPEYRESNFGLVVKNYNRRALCPAMTTPRHALARLKNRRHHRPSQSQVIEINDGNVSRPPFPSSCLFECPDGACKFFKAQFFFCDGCETPVPLNTPEIVHCVLCSKVYCLKHSSLCKCQPPELVVE